MSEPVWIVPFLAHEIIKIRQFIADDRIAHPHGGFGMASPQRIVFRHAFHEPKRQTAHVHACLGGIIKLEGVDQLVSQDMMRDTVIRCQRHHDPFLNGLGQAAHAAGNESRHDIGLPEIGVVGIENERFAIAFGKLMIGDAGKSVLPALGHSGHVGHEGPHFGIIEDAKVVGFDLFEIEGLVLDFVATELLRVNGRDSENDAYQE